MPRDPRTAAAADVKVQAALDHLEEAQRLLGRACEELCPILGAVRRWEAVGRLYDRVHAEWHRLNGFAQSHRGELDLDDGGRRELERALGGTP